MTLKSKPCQGVVTTWTIPKCRCNHNHKKHQCNLDHTKMSIIIKFNYWFLWIYMWPCMCVYFKCLQCLIRHAMVFLILLHILYNFISNDWGLDSRSNQVPIQQKPSTIDKGNYNKLTLIFTYIRWQIKWEEWGVQILGQCHRYNTIPRCNWITHIWNVHPFL